MPPSRSGFSATWNRFWQRGDGVLHFQLRGTAAMACKKPGPAWLRLLPSTKSRLLTALQQRVYLQQRVSF